MASIDQRRPFPVERLERAMLSSWPALSTAFDGDWVIRLSKGVTKRSNSVVCLGGDAADIENRIDRVRTIFDRHGLPPVFRISPLAPLALNDCLDARGWRRFDETIVMTADLTKMSADDGSRLDVADDMDIRTEPDVDWLDGCERLNGYAPGQVDILRPMLRSLVPMTGYGRLTRSDDIVAIGMAVVDHDLVGLFEVMTAADRRRRGYGRALQSRLLRWGREQHATTGWLAVVADNAPACCLYRSLGFREVYRYHYRAEG